MTHFLIKSVLPFLLGLYLGWHAPTIAYIASKLNPNELPDITEKLANAPEATVRLKDLIGGNFFCVGDRESSLTAGISNVFGDYISNQYTYVELFWTIASLNADRRTVIIYTVNPAQLSLGKGGCGQQLELQIDKSSDPPVATSQNVEIEHLGTSYRTNR